jgi:isopenicillin-N N-acyltransferase-like protein
MLLLLLCAAASAVALPPSPPSCAGAVNARPLTPGGAAPVLNTTANGSSKRVVTDNLTAPLTVLHVYGSVYDMHRAVGELLQEEIAALVPAALAYLYSQVNASYNLSWLPEPVRDWVVEYGVEAALDWTFNATQQYTPAHWGDALRGLSEGSGVSPVQLARVSMIAEWTRAQCSMLGAWGPATPSGGLVQLRALDWDVDGPFQAYPVLTVFHPDAASGGAPNAALGWAGMLGAITGVSSTGVSGP